MKRIIILIVILLSVLTHCKQKTNIADAETIEIKEFREVAPIKLVKKMEVKINNQTGLDTVPKLLAMPEHLLVLYLDPTLSKPVKIFCDAYTHDLKLKWHKELFVGQGPEDLSLAFRVFYLNGKVYCLDYGSQSLSIFDENMNFLSTKKLPNAGQYSFFSSDAKRFFWIERTRGLKYHNIYTSKINGGGIEKFASFGPFEGDIIDREKGLLILKKRPDIIQFRREETVFLVNCKEYSVFRWDKSGRIDRSIRTKVSETLLSKEENEFYMKMRRKGNRLRQGKLKWVFDPIVQPVGGVVCLKKGFIALRQKNYDLECHGTIEGDYYSYDLEPLGKVQFPCFVSHVTQFCFNTQQLWNNGIYLVKEASEEENSDYITYWEVLES